MGLKAGRRLHLGTSFSSAYRRFASWVTLLEAVVSAPPIAPKNYTFHLLTRVLFIAT